jgi:hypothetical protein
MNRFVVVLLLVLASCSAPAPEQNSDSPVAVPEAKVGLQGLRFTGEVQHGESFEREFGDGLLFRLRAEKDPMMPGWYIAIGTAGRTPEVELSDVVTIPLRGFNPKYLSLSYGNTAADVVAFKERGFVFLKNPADAPRETALQRTLLWPPSQEEYQKALDSFGRSPQCQGMLRILDHRLFTPSGETREQIEWLKFEVELCGR